MKKRLGNLLSVKSLVTLTLTIVFTVLALRGDITGKDFLTIFLTVITFYFGSQSQKLQDALDGSKNAQEGEQK
ncbi:MAG: hypothetical protein KH299_07815 [Firmicutes bacterium]|nr:hypothetical protein [Bacillota bacterium]